MIVFLAGFFIGGLVGAFVMVSVFVMALDDKAGGDE